MKKLLVIATVLGALALSVGSVQAQDGDPKKKIDPELLKKLQDKIGNQIDPEMVKKLLEKFGDGKFDPEMVKKLLDKVGGANGKFDPEMLKKLLDKVGGNGKFDLDKLKKLQDKFGKGAKGGLDLFGKTDVEALFKKLDTDKNGKLSKEEFMKLTDEFKDRIGEDKMEMARVLVARMYEQLDPDGAGVTLEQFRKGIAEFQKKKTDK
jgi:Ca2+-binding EF-hand superfamily protein